MGNGKAVDAFPAEKQSVALSEASKESKEHTFTKLARDLCGTRPIDLRSRSTRFTYM